MECACVSVLGQVKGHQEVSVILKHNIMSGYAQTQTYTHILVCCAANLYSKQ